LQVEEKSENMLRMKLRKGCALRARFFGEAEAPPFHRARLRAVFRRAEAPKNDIRQKIMESCEKREAAIRENGVRGG